MRYCAVPRQLTREVKSSDHLPVMPSLPFSFVSHARRLWVAIVKSGASKSRSVTVPDRFSRPSAVTAPVIGSL